jgi:nucleoid DNA-binding protein
MGKQTILEVSRILTDKNGLVQREASRFVSEMFALILEQLQQGEQVKIKGFGTFKIVGVEARESVSVRTGERVVIDSHSKVTFTPDNTMKELVNKPFSQFETVVLNDGVSFEDLKEDNSEETVAALEEETPAESISLLTDEAMPIIVDNEESLVAKDEELSVAEEEVLHAAEDEVLPGAEDEENNMVCFDDDDDDSHPWGRWLLGALGVLALMALSAYGGYQYGSHRKLVAVTDTVVVKDTIYRMSVDTPETALPVAPGTLDNREKPETPETLEKTDKSAKMTQSPVDKYAEKDERVRLGAYRIVGLEREVTVLPGQTFYSICRAHLGPDMECYVEVYNDLPSHPKIKSGQVIKIPKLELKKRRK